MEWVHYRSVFADVSKGKYSASPVAVKRLRVNEGGYHRVFKVPSIDSTSTRFSTFAQRFCREVIGWKHLIHPNILPLLGVYMSPDSNRFDILTDWMPNGNLVQYAKSNPEVNRLKLVSMLAIPSFAIVRLFTDDLQLSEVMSGVAYLHNLSIVHGDLKGVNAMFLVCFLPH